MTKSRGINRPKTCWTPVMVELLRQWYPIHCTRVIADALQLTETAVYRKASRLCLYKSGKSPAAAAPPVPHRQRLDVKLDIAIDQRLRYSAESGELEKFCVKCSDWWPADREFFLADAKGIGGLHSYCKACFREHIRPLITGQIAPPREAAPLVTDLGSILGAWNGLTGVHLSTQAEGLQTTERAL